MSKLFPAPFQHNFPSCRPNAFPNFSLRFLLWKHHSWTPWDPADLGSLGQNFLNTWYLNISKYGLVVSATLSTKQAGNSSHPRTCQVARICWNPQRLASIRNCKPSRFFWLKLSNLRYRWWEREVVEKFAQVLSSQKSSAWSRFMFGLPL